MLGRRSPIFGEAPDEDSVISHTPLGEEVYYPPNIGDDLVLDEEEFMGVEVPKVQVYGLNFKDDQQFRLNLDKLRDRSHFAAMRDDVETTAYKLALIRESIEMAQKGNWQAIKTLRETIVNSGLGQFVPSEDEAKVTVTISHDPLIF